MYYLRSRPAVDPIKFTLDMEKIMQNTKSDSMAQANVFNRYKKKTKRIKVKVRVKRKKSHKGALKKINDENTMPGKIPIKKV